MKKYQHWFESSVICSIVCFNYKVLRWVCWLLCVAEHFLMTEMICALCFQRESPSWWRRHGSIRKLTKNIFNLGWKEERASNLEVGQGYKLSKTIFTVVLYKDLCARDTKLPEQHLHLGTTCSNTWASVDIYHSITEGDNIGTRETLVTRQHMRYKFATLVLYLKQRFDTSGSITWQCLTSWLPFLSMCLELQGPVEASRECRVFVTLCWPVTRMQLLQILL